jgi:myo-inositol-1(or 4)-monophosphatase
MNTAFYKQLETDAREWVEEAGKILISHEHNFVVATQKDEVDVATNADTEVEQFLTKLILEKYPEHAIYGEEFGLTKEHATYTWIIDPLDCTKEYVRGIGEYNCLIAVEEDGVIVAGVIQRFGHKLLYWASKGNGAFLDSKQITVSTASSLDHSFIGINTPSKKTYNENEISSYLDLEKKVIKQSYRVRSGSDDAKLFSWVAQGAFDASISLPRINKWFDVAPALLLVEEAGGKVTDWQGNPLLNHDLSKGILVSNTLLHDQLLGIINS